ncbi:4-hydroxybutyrate--acetyl-CoA CoA transferase [Legionella septentrionalis]|nr:4-hydroxybutyrate--acetyl-CoA CoA transferase [Legionella septentrionalis]
MMCPYLGALNEFLQKPPRTTGKTGMFEEMYKQKRMRAEEAVNCIAKEGNIALSWGPSQPPSLLNALAARGRKGEIDKLHVYYLHSYKSAFDSIFAPDLLDIFRPVPMSGLSELDREMLQAGLKENKKLLSVLPTNFSEIPRLFESRKIPLDTFMLTVAPMDKGGNFSLGISNAYSLMAARHCKNLIVEVNKYMPRVFGEASLHISEIDALVENDQPIDEIPARANTEEDNKIGQYIVERVPDGATIQLGIGGIPNAICESLVHHKDLGIHTELFCSGMVDLIEQGVVTGLCKKLNRGKHVYTICLGDKRTYDFIDDNASVEAYPVSYVNNFNTISQFKNFMSINSAVQVDFFGQINAEFIGGRTYSGVGGQNDFVRGALASEGGRSFIAFSSTAKKGTVSRIVPIINKAATDLRMDAHYIVTEYGIVDVKGLTTAQRTKALIGIAHPKFREELLSIAKRERYI